MSAIAPSIGPKIVTIGQQKIREQVNDQMANLLRSKLPLGTGGSKLSSTGKLNSFILFVPFCLRSLCQLELQEILSSGLQTIPDLLL